METLLACINVRNRPIYELLTRAGQVTQRLMPRLGLRTAADTTILREIQGGWTFTTARRKSPLITEHVTPTLAVLAYGELFTHDRRKTARKIGLAWQAGGATAVRRLDGCFGAVLVDRPARQFFVLSDQIGRRTLRLWHDGRTLLVSTHDVPLVATGLCPVDVNLNSARSMIVFDWSLNGRSLLKNVQVHHPNTYVVANADTERIEIVEHPLLTLDQRIDSHDHVTQQRQIDAMIGHMQQIVKYACKDANVVETDLTAGIDSRAALGLLLSVLDADKVKTETAGEKNSVDAQVAGQIAARYGLAHSTYTPEVPTLETFLEHARTLAFCANGDTNGKRAADNPLPKDTREHSPRQYGVGGELFRGYFYPQIQPAALQKLTPEICTNFLLTKKFSRLYKLPWRDKHVAEVVADQLHHTLTNYTKLGARGADYLDLFYLFERIGRWASFSARGPWWHYYFTPFVSPKLVRMAFQLSAPIGYDVRLHKRIVSRYLSHAYWIPVNNAALMPLIGTSWQHKKAAAWLKRFLTIQRKLRQKGRFWQKSRHRNLTRIQASFFSEQLQGELGEMLLSSDGICLALFDNRGAEQLVQQHVHGKSNHVQTVGALISVELWRSLVRDAAWLARRPFRSVVSIER